jgi:hypothetical protein
VKRAEERLVVVQLLPRVNVIDNHLAHYGQHFRCTGVVLLCWLGVAMVSFEGRELAVFEVPILKGAITELAFFKTSDKLR